MKNLFWLLLLSPVLLLAQGQSGGKSQVALASGPYKVASLPKGQAKGTLANVSDGNSATDCTVGGGSTLVTCKYSGSAWAVFGNSGGSGTVTSVSGTTNQIDVATGTTTPVISLDSAIVLPGSLTAGTGASITVSGTGTNNANNVNGAVVPASALVVASNSSRQLIAATGFLPFAGGSQALGTPTVTNGTCSSAITASTTGVVTTDTISATPAVDPSGVSGYAPAAGGNLFVVAYPTSGTVNFKVCNPTAAGITPAALTMNWTVTHTQ